VKRARVTSDQEFARSTEPFLSEIRLHCYRMLGSVHDADDAVQETLLRAWRHERDLRDASARRAWLYRIATNVCLRAVSRQQPLPAGGDPTVEFPPPNAAGAVTAPPTPYPDSLIDTVADDPSGRYELRESVELAFLAAVQLLPPRQRAVLLLRDVLGLAGGGGGEHARLLGREREQCPAARPRDPGREATKAATSHRPRG